MTLRDHNTAVFEDDSGNKKEIKSNVRYYVSSEITWMLKSLGYRKIDIFGAKLGAYSRKDELTPEDFEILIVAEKRWFNLMANRLNTKRKVFIRVFG